MEHAAKEPRILELPTDDGHYQLQECHRVFWESTAMFVPDYRDDIVFTTNAYSSNRSGAIQPVSSDDVRTTGVEVYLFRPRMWTTGVVVSMM